MWSCLVAIGPPASERDAASGQRGEQRLVQYLIPQLAVEALDEGVLHRLARRDVGLGDAALIDPCRRRSWRARHRCRCPHLGPAALDHQLVQFPRHPGAREVSATNPDSRGCGRRPRSGYGGDGRPWRIGIQYWRKASTAVGISAYALRRKFLVSPPLRGAPSSGAP